MSGDMLATFMAWLADVPAGGGTGYDFPTKEMLVEPSRGAAAFWMDLKSSGQRESVRLISISFLSWRQSYKIKVLLIRTKLVLNSLMVRYFIFG